MSHRLSQFGDAADRLAFTSLLVLALTLPMEIRVPLFRVGPVGVTDVELSWYITLLSGAAVVKIAPAPAHSVRGIRVDPSGRIDVDCRAADVSDVCADGGGTRL